MEVRIDVYNHGFAEFCHFVERTAGPVALKTTPQPSLGFNSVNSSVI
jgi:hypothetical protein